MGSRWNIEPFVELADLLKGPNFERVVYQSICSNDWFTRDGIGYAVEAICDKMLNAKLLTQWLAEYSPPKGGKGRRVGIVMAGNLPMVGFFDLMCVLLAGHAATVKLSSKDSVLMGYVVEVLASKGLDVEVCERIDRLDVDAVIVTGADSTVDHFRAEFAGLPAVYRGSRGSLAVVDAPNGEVLGEQLGLLVDDMFMHWGLGCRNVTELLVPEDCNISELSSRFRAISKPEWLSFESLNQAYRYNRAINAMQGVEGAYDCGFFTLAPRAQGVSVRMAEIVYTKYDEGELGEIIKVRLPKLQCVVMAMDSSGREEVKMLGVNPVNYGQSQRPELDDWADGIDLMRFLLEI